MKTTTLYSLVTVALTVLSTFAQGELPPAERLLEMKRPLVIAHRGFSMAAPENTLPAFDLALHAGADLVELDYYHSKDRIPVIFHDRTLDRTSDAIKVFGGKDLPIKERTAAELAKLDAGAWFSPTYAGARITTLNDSLDFIQKRGVTLIERKDGEAAVCVKLLREKKLVNQVVVQAFDWEYLADYHKQEPTQVLGALGPASTIDGRRLTDAEKRLNAKWIDLAQKTGARVVVWSRAIDKASVDYAHSKKLDVWVYTINEQALANELLDMGIDGIITDNPAMLWRALALRSMKK